MLSVISVAIFLDQKCDKLVSVELNCCNESHGQQHVLCQQSDQNVDPGHSLSDDFLLLHSLLTTLSTFPSPC